MFADWHKAYADVATALYQVLKESKFKEHGRITPGESALSTTRSVPAPPALLGRRLLTSPLARYHRYSPCSDEFVAAGEFLTYKFPVWTW